MSDLLSIGSGAAHLYRQALATVSNNIANLNTDGYSRQDVTMAENNPSQKGTIYLGTGARVTGIARAYDEFVESSLRDSGSEYSTQAPMIEYANRIVDLMGSEASGLSNVLDKFFASAHELSADAASTTLRTVFLRDADSVADRFRELSSHLDSLDQTIQENITYQIDSINNYANKLLAVNKQLGRKTNANEQSPALMDERDKLLRELSNVAKINIIEDKSGQVTISLDGGNSQSAIVRKDSTTLIGVEFKPGDLGRVDILYNPYGEQRPVSSVSSGTLGGLINFRSQILSPAMDGLDHLAQTLTAEINEIHTAGLDARGDRGKAIFEIEPVFQVTSPTLLGSVEVDVEVSDVKEFNYSPFEMRWVAEGQMWRIADESSGDVNFVKENLGLVNYAGLEISIDGDKLDGDTFFIRPVQRPAAGMTSLLSDPFQVAAAQRLRIKESENNVGNAVASLTYLESDDSPLFETGVSITSLNNESNEVASVQLVQNVGTVHASNISPAFTIPKGTDQVTIKMDIPVDSDLNFQVMNKDGVHLLGSVLSETLQTSLRSQDGGFDLDSEYSDAYLNKEKGAGSYLDWDMTYGFLAESGTREELVVDKDSGQDGEPLGLISQQVAYRASATSQAIHLSSTNSGVSKSLIESGDLSLNGIALGALALNGTTNLESSAALMRDWVNSVSNNSKVTAVAETKISSSPENINLLDQIAVNGTLVGDGAIPSSIDALVLQINAKSNVTKVTASVGNDGGVELTNLAGHEGKNISLSNPTTGATTNALGLSNKTFTGQLIFDSQEKIRFTFGAAGKAADLSMLGLQAGVYIKNPTPDELAVFVTGTDSAEVSVGFRNLDDMDVFAERPFSIEFLSQSKYQIVDAESNTIVATRSYDHGKGIDYQNLKITFNELPSKDDVFLIDDNKGGTGDNSNIIKIANLRNVRVVNDEETINEAYLNIVNVAGTKATLAEVSEAALKVVFDQATQAREDRAGVSLDEEAADLIRYQQAYQASAQVIQVSAKIFDAILGVG